MKFQSKEAFLHVFTRPLYEDFLLVKRFFPPILCTSSMFVHRRGGKDDSFLHLTIPLGLDPVVSHTNYGRDQSGRPSQSQPKIKNGIF